MSCWNGALRASGGSLKPIKCSWGFLGYWWDNGKWKFLSRDQFPAQITVPGPDGHLLVIKRNEPSEAIKVVSVFQALDGNMGAQWDDLVECAMEWGIMIWDGWVP